MKNASNLDDEVSFGNASPSRRTLRLGAQQALMNADLDEDFPWHRIRRMSRK
ncbi:hypothetical protein ACIPEN_02280 [Herbaspirillum chlorophenolicum]|uniref:Uncharacterized protein n=1 Tax=Herbaspirillum chlorophenolicum TaxID=211589 RepID=A0ABW8EUW2_9BURK|nr:hypothetical protein [Herbaspirillum chlorophenolicum]